MKPVAIIAISVGCSVVAVLGVLVALEMYAVNEAQKAYAIELERQAVCERLYDGYAQSLRDTELWGICINYGISEAVNEEVSDCGRGTHHTTELCRLDTKILAMKVVDQEITLDTKFKQSFTSNLSNLQESRTTLVEQRQIEEQQNQLKFSEMASTETQWKSKYLFVNPTNWYPIYQHCMESDIKHYETEFLHKQLCDNTLKSAISEKCDGLNCGLTFADVIADNVDQSKLIYNTEHVEWEETAHSCSFQGSVTYLPLEEVKECICKNEIDYYAWHDLCRSNNNSITQSSSKPVPESMTFLQIKMDYYECITDEQYGTQCQDSLKENMDEYCRMTTESHSEYDECFGQITDIQ